MKVKDLEELYDKVHGVYEGILGDAFKELFNTATSDAQICNMAYDFAFTAVIHEDDFFIKSLQANINDIIVLEPEVRKKVKPAYADTLLMYEVIMKGGQQVTIFGETGKLASMVLSYISKEGISLSDPVYAPLLKYISSECPERGNSFPLVFNPQNEDMSLRAEYVLAQYFKACSPLPCKLRHNKRGEPINKRIEHLLMDVLLEHLTRQKEAIQEELKSKGNSGDIGELLKKFTEISTKRNKLCVALGQDTFN